MDKSELDLIIQVQLFAHRNNSTGVDAKKHKDKERERIMQQYFFNGHQICRKTFVFAHAIPVNLWELLGGRSPPYQLF
jgi:hypothetical protein